MLTPYKYTLNKENSTLIVACRSDIGERVIHTYEVQPRILLDVSSTLGSTEDIIENLKNALNTDNIVYDENLRRYIVSGSIEGVEDDISSYFKSIVAIPLNTSSAIQGFGRRFFDQIENDGTFTNKRVETTNFNTIFWNIKVEIPLSGGSPSPYINPITIITFIRPHIDKEVQIWSIFPSLGGRYYKKEGEMLWAFYDMIKECDIDVTFNGIKFDWDYLISRLGITDNVTIKDKNTNLGMINYKELQLTTLDHIDLYSISQLVYPYFTRHDLDTVSRNIINKSKIDLDINEMKSLTNSEMNGTSTIEQKTRLLILKQYLIVDIQLLMDLYEHFAPILTNLSFMSGYNLGDITNEDLYRGIMSYINSLIAYNQLTNITPKEFLTAGVYKNCFSVAFGPLLQYGLISSTDEMTRAVGFSLTTINSYTWIINKIFRLDGLKPHDLNNISNVFGIKDGLAYFTQVSPDTKIIKNWSLFIVIGNGSWIGITTIKEIKNFTYKGLASICKHPFPAVKACVEMFITCSIDNTPITKLTAVNTTALNKETTAIKKKITISNINTYKYLLNNDQILAIEQNNCSYIPITIYYTSNKNVYTLDYNLVDLDSYRSELTKIMKTLPSLN